MEGTRHLSERYQVLRALGVGAMGEVVLARDLRLDMDVAIKRIPAHLASEPVLAAALLREARILARLNDPRIVRLFDLTETPDGLLLVMEYVCGPSLHGLLQAHGPLREDELFAVMRDVTGGLAAAHAGGVIHRDLKPANILMALAPQDQAAYLSTQTVPRNLDGMRAKVADFGIAKLLEGAQTGTAFATAGSPRYMAPEQFRGEMPSPETDVYALGVIAYQALTGQVPFPSGDPAYYHLSVPPPPLPNQPAHLNSVVQRALSKHRQDRFPSVEAFQQALEGRSFPVLPPLPPLLHHSMPPLPKPSPDWPFWSVVGVVVMLAVLILAASWTLTRQSRDRPGQERGSATGAGIAEPAGTVALDVRPAPYVESLPPVVEEAGPPQQADPGEIVGPRNPRALWKARFTIPGSTHMSVAGVGSDGTVYLIGDATGSGLSGGAICAIREGKPLWSYSGVDRYNQLVIAPDGRIWMVPDDPSSDRPKFCFNSRGEGGRVSSKEPSPLPKRKPRFTSTLAQQYGVGAGLHWVGAGYHCTTPGERPFGRNIGRPGLSGKPWGGGADWFLPLTHDCVSNTLIIGPAGDAYFATAGNALYRVSTDGKVQWSTSAPARLKRLYPLASGDVALVSEHEFNRVKNGAFAWKAPIGFDVKTSVLFDRNETAYVTEEFNAGFLYQPDSRVAAIDAEGQRVWERKFLKCKAESLYLDAHGRLYVAGVVGDGNKGSWGVICLGDS